LVCRGQAVTILSKVNFATKGKASFATTMKTVVAELALQNGQFLAR
jgi:hypothetical protein